jgi:hypothetical protein
MAKVRTILPSSRLAVYIFIHIYGAPYIYLFIKYVCLGGTFALYSLICRYVKVGLIPNQQAEDREVSNFQLELPSSREWMASRVKSKLESSQFAKFFLLLATMLGTSMVIGDGVLTPCISGAFNYLLFYPLYLENDQLSNVVTRLLLVIADLLETMQKDE